MGKILLILIGIFLCWKVYQSRPSPTKMKATWHFKQSTIPEFVHEGKDGWGKENGPVTIPKMGVVAHNIIKVAKSVNDLMECSDVKQILTPNAMPDGEKVSKKKPKSKRENGSKLEHAGEKSSTSELDKSTGMNGDETKQSVPNLEVDMNHLAKRLDRAEKRMSAECSSSSSSSSSESKTNSRKTSRRRRRLAEAFA